MLDVAPSMTVPDVRFEAEIPLDQLEISELNPRSSRDETKIEEIAGLMRDYGFDPAYALKVYPEDGGYRVFAGGNRLMAARRAGLATVPVHVFEGRERSELWKLAYQDNIQAGKHCEVSPVDVWQDYAERITREGWTQAEMAEWLGVSQPIISMRIRLNDAKVLQKPVSDGLLDESHCEAILAVYPTSDKLDAWLTTEQARQELVAEVLDRHVGSSVGVKPSVRVVREAAKRWKSLIQTAEQACESLENDDLQQRFVAQLAAERARSEADINRVLSRFLEERRREREREAAQLRSEADVRDREAEQIAEEERRSTFLEQQTGKLRHGDARDLIREAPAGFSLLLTDPPYGMQFQSNRRVASGKKPRIANDEKENALDLLRDVLNEAYPRMADDATALIFTGWRFEPEFRQIIEAAGFEIKGSLVWVKPNHGAGDLTGSFAPQHERIIHAVKGKPKLRKRISDVLTSKPHGGGGTANIAHPTEKPRELLRTLIEAVTDPGDVVVDPFMGSGNTLLEAYDLQRAFFGIELDSRWHQSAVDAIYQMAQERYDG